MPFLPCPPKKINDVRSRTLFWPKVTPDCQELPSSLSWRFSKQTSHGRASFSTFFLVSYPHSDLFFKIPHWGRTVWAVVKGSQGPRLQVPNELVTTLHPPVPLCFFPVHSTLCLWFIAGCLWLPFSGDRDRDRDWDPTLNLNLNESETMPGFGAPLVPYPVVIGWPCVM